MSTAYETREKKDDQKIAEVQRKSEQATDMPERTVRTMPGGVKIVVKEDHDSGLVQQTRIGGGWGR